MPEIVTSYLHGLIGFHFQLLVAFPLLVCAELAFPRGSQPSTLVRLRSLVFWSVYSLASVAVMLAFAEVLGAMGLKPLGMVPPFSALPSPVGAIAAAVVGVCIGDFFFYWLHRLEHSKLWRFHRLHHSVRHLNAMSGFHHFTEEGFRLLFITVPVFFLIGDPASAFPMVGALAYIQGHYLHSCTRLHLGPLRFVFQDNRFHRIHHSVEPRHFDKNFGAVTPFWDILFGTAYFPRHDEWPVVGLADCEEPNDVREYLTFPFVEPRSVASAVGDPVKVGS